MYVQQMILLEDKKGIVVEGSEYVDWENVIQMRRFYVCMYGGMIGSQDQDQHQEQDQDLYFEEGRS